MSDGEGGGVNGKDIMGKQTMKLAQIFFFFFLEKPVSEVIRSPG